ncbi:hypothetical protein FB451DRAFT_1403359 [Mycena latifolia]|nr:hypothetical protein FB451DRAFT_1403359 [Mycena latifolia]
MAAVNLVPTIESTALPSTPATENTNDVLAYADGRAVKTPDPSMPGAFPEDPHGMGEARGESYLPAEAEQSALASVGQAAKLYVPSHVAGYFGGEAVDSAAPEREIREESPIPSPASETTDLSTTVHTGDSASDTAIAPPSPSPARNLTPGDFSSTVRPPFVPRSSSFHSHAFGAAGSASSSIYSPDPVGYAPLASTPASPASNASVAPSDKSAIAALLPPGLPAGAPFTPIPPVSPPEVVAYFPIADGLHEPAKAKPEEEEAAAARASEVELNAIGHLRQQTDEAAQRAAFSDPQYGVLGREEAVPARPEAPGDAAVFTAYGLHVPAGPAARAIAEGGEGEEEHVGADADNEAADNAGENGEGNGKGKGRRSRLVAKLKEKIHV